MRRRNRPGFVLALFGSLALPVAAQQAQTTPGETGPDPSRANSGTSGLDDPASDHQIVPSQLSPQQTLGDPKAIAVLQGLDKITARISTFEAPLNEAVTFGSLAIVARACYKTPPVEPPESAAFLEIDDARPGRPRVPLFTGWMYASSPAISALEHPVYDVWVVDCRTDAPVPQGSQALQGDAGTN